MNDRRYVVLDTPADDALLVRLRRVAAEADAAPRTTYEHAMASFALRALDTELAVLLLDSAEPGQALAGVRGSDEVRLLSYQAPGVDLELQWVEQGERRSLTGQVIGAQVEAVVVDAGDTEHSAQPDNCGVFWLEDLAAGLSRVRLRMAGGLTVSTPWVQV